MSDRFLPVRDADLAYDVDGSGPVAVQLHGLSSSREGDLDLGLDLRGLAGDGHRLIRYDARGHGASTGRPEPGDYRWSALADDLIALAEHVRAGEPVDWIGQSMGTGTLLHAAVRSPARFRRLVLEIPPTTGETREMARDMYRQSADFVETQGKEAWVRGMQQFGVPEIFADVPNYRYDADVRGDMLPWVLRGAARTDLPPAEALATLTHPTLILAWESDPVHPVSTAEYLVKTLPDARLHVSSTAADVRTWPARVAEFLRS